MSLILNQLEQALAATPGSLKQARAFSKKVSSFVSTAQNRKEADRLLPFCSDADFLLACRSALGQHENHREELGEIIPFWCLLVCVLIDASKDDDALAALHEWAQARITADDGNALMLLQRYLDAYADSPRLGCLRNQVAAAHEALQARLPVAQCFEQLGIKRPPAGELWLLAFSLATVPLSSPFDPMPSEAIRLEVDLGSRLRARSNSQYSLKISCPARGGTLGTDCGDGPFQLHHAGQWHELPPVDLVRLPEHIRQIEALYGVQFQRDAFASFRKHGLRQRDIEARLLGWLRED